MLELKLKGYGEISAYRWQFYESTYRY